MLHLIEDKRINCISILTRMRISKYITLVNRISEGSGGLEGQRATLRTRTAKRIRERMVQDIAEGAVLPPVVIGLTIDGQQEAKLKATENAEELFQWLDNANEDRISIIDGMQRTAAIKEALDVNPEIKQSEIRVEIWVAQRINSLIYRMLILNTGQVPWELDRQLETIYRPFLFQVKQELDGDVEIFTRDDKRRRVSHGQFQGSKIIELFLIFTTRKLEVDIKDKVAEDFTKLDTVEAIAHDDFVQYFIRVLRIIVRFDRVFSKFNSSNSSPRQEVDDLDKERFKWGKDIFQSVPALAGFCCACAVYLFDEPGFPIEWETVPKRIQEVEKRTSALKESLETKTGDEIKEFLQIDLLENSLSRKSGQVGRFEREFFYHAFHVFIRKADQLDKVTMEPCWRAR